MGDRIRIMVTGVGGGGIGAQILKALRMSDKNYFILGGDMTPVSKGLMEVDLPFILPRGNEPQYIDQLLDICQREGAQVLLPGSEPELLAISEHRAKITDQGIFLPIQPKPVIDICGDKTKTAAFLEEHGFDFPRTVTIRKAEDIHQVDFFPAVLKPSVGTGGSAGVMLAQTPGEIKMFGSYMLEDYQHFIAQEYVGTMDSEYTVGVLTSMDGELINSVAIKRNIVAGISNRLRTKNRSGRAELGPTLAISSGLSQGELGRFEEVTKPAERIALKLGATGAINIQCRFVDGRIYVFEINPRYSGTTSMRAIVGYNEPDILIRKHLLGETIEAFFPYNSGHIARGLKEVLVDLERTNRNCDAQ